MKEEISKLPNEKLRFFYPKPYMEAKIRWRENDIFPDVNFISPIVTKERYTICGIYDSVKHVLSIGVAKCAVEDKFEKEIGRNIAYNNAKIKPYATISTDKKTLSEKFISIAKLIESQLYGPNLEYGE